jgi:hypothetical protein
MTDILKDKILGDSVEPRSFEALSLKEKLELVGVNVVPVKTPDGKGFIDPYGISESMDLFDLLATVTNKVVNKDTFLDFNLVQKAFATYTGAKDIPKELQYITEVELTEIQERITATLKFTDPSKEKLEKLVESIVFTGLVLLSSITAYARKDT